MDIVERIPPGIESIKYLKKQPILKRIKPYDTISFHGNEDFKLLVYGSPYKPVRVCGCVGGGVFGLCQGTTMTMMNL